jgi:hypothetical protein
MRRGIVGGSLGRSLASAARVARGFPRRISNSARSCHRRLNTRARQLLTGYGEAARLFVEMVWLSAKSARESLRSMVLLRRLYVRRAEVIYSAGCAALNGEDRRVEHARAELRLLDELIAAASNPTTLASTTDESAPAVPDDVPIGGSAHAAPADVPTEEPADVPTEESVLMPRVTNRVPALRRGH